MSNIIEMVNAKNKAISVIDSCKTDIQVQCADRYVELFNIKFDDYLTYNELRQRLDAKLDKLSENDKKN